MILVPVEAGRNIKSVAVDRGPFVVPGFQISAVASGMRYRDRLDLALVVAGPVSGGVQGAGDAAACEADATPGSDGGAVAAGVFTTNRFTAAPVELCKRHLKSPGVKGILVNAGIANACTGETGMERAMEMARLAAVQLAVPPESILVASTGVIGRQIDLQPVELAMPELVKGLRPEGWEDAGRAIMTTDTVPKWASTRLDLGGKTVTIGGIAKGSGMIAPNMATLLTFVCTDALISREVLDYWVRTGADGSFNCITVDGDTSTNDCLLVLAGGYACNSVLADVESPESRRFGQALSAVLLDLAKQIIMDGEGATKFVEIRVTGAPDQESARTVAFTVAHSPLVKTAFFGEDANWGRIVAAAGRSGVPLIPEKVALFFDEVCVFRAGTPIEDRDVEEKATAVFRQKEMVVHLDLGMGKACYTTYTCDLSYDYVKINASYRS